MNSNNISKEFAEQTMDMINRPWIKLIKELFENFDILPSMTL